MFCVHFSVHASSCSFQFPLHASTHNPPDCVFITGLCPYHIFYACLLMAIIILSFKWDYPIPKSISPRGLAADKKRRKSGVNVFLFPALTSHSHPVWGRLGFCLANFPVVLLINIVYLGEKRDAYDHLELVDCLFHWGGGQRGLNLADIHSLAFIKAAKNYVNT